MKVALVHDFLCQYGGAERVVEELHDLFPEAPIFTSIYVPERLPDHFRQWDIRTSFMQSLPGIGRHFKKYLPFYPMAFRRFSLEGFDLVISSSSAFAKGVRVPAGAKHLCYCYTPMRFVWAKEDYLAKEPIPLVFRPLLPPVLAWLKRRDIADARGVDRFIAISAHIQKRIRAAYGRESEILYPPTDVERFAPGPNDGYFLIISRLNAYKKLDIAIEAFRGFPGKLVIVGQGPDLARLRALAGPNVEFAGGIAETELRRRLSRCRALIFPGTEDFGLVPVEAMASGKPVVAFAAGGALETVKEGETGIFFHQPTPESLRGALSRAAAMVWDPEAIRAHARRFDTAQFRRGFLAAVDALMGGVLDLRPGVK